MKLKCMGGHVERFCPICENNNQTTLIIKRVHGRDPRVKYIVKTADCINCNIYYQSPILPDKFLNDLYEKSNRTEKYFIKKHQHDIECRKSSALSFSKYVKNCFDFKILEIGCSSGYNIENINNKFDKVYTLGVDIDEVAVNYGKSRGLNLMCIDAFTLKNEFNVVLINHVLEHITNPKDFLSSVKNLLSKDGIIVINVPNSFVRTSENSKRNENGCEKPGCEHVNYFSEDGMSNLLKKVGFNNFDISSVIIHETLAPTFEIRAIIHNNV